MSNGLLNGLTEAWAPDASLAMIGQKTGLNTGTEVRLSYVANAGFPGGHALRCLDAAYMPPQVLLQTAPSALIEAIGVTDFLYVQWVKIGSSDTKVQAYFAIGEENTNGVDSGVSNGPPLPQSIYAELPGADNSYSAFFSSDPAKPFTADVDHMVATWYTNADSTLRISLDAGTVYSIVNTSGIGPADPTNYAYWVFGNTDASPPVIDTYQGPVSLWQGAGVANAVSQLGSLFADKLQYSDFDSGSSAPSSQEAHMHPDVGYWWRVKAYNADVAPMDIAYEWRLHSF